jgi:hypothetical protein
MEKTQKLNTGANMTEVQLRENYDYFIDFLRKNFKGERLEKLLNLYSENRYGIQLTTAPASGKASFHYAFPGGYLLHVMNVEKVSRGIQKVFQVCEGTVDYTEEERIFAALNHDLGKLGDEEFGPYYLPQTDEWRQRKLGEIYAHNNDSPPWDVTDRALYILQKEGILLTWKETLAIKLSDGMFEEKNIKYYKAFDGLKTRLPEMIHWADWMSARIEKSQWEKLQ